MKTVAFFNNKGGVGKTSLVYHLAWMFADLGKRVIVADLDPQSNLTSAFLSEEAYELLFSGSVRTVHGALVPLINGTGDISEPYIDAIGDRIGLLPGDLSLSRFEDKLSREWPSCVDGDPRSFRVISSFFRLIKNAADRFQADVAFIDIGPNLGAINRSALLSSDYVVIPLAPDLYSLQGMKNLGPTLRDWRGQWNDRLARKPTGLDISLPRGGMEPIGYILMRHSIRLDRPVKSFDRWMTKMPAAYSDFVLGVEDETSAEHPSRDRYCLGMLKDYRSLMPMALEANKPIFHLTAADGAIGAHYAYVKDARDDFGKLACRIANQIGMDLSP
ncbi:MAG: AAA family ATPase [Rhodospirillales bacterium]|jgi:cellulose biosynthesis protein BcsQ|nr:AAA family ATPase [Rhodospirillales bacterium]